MNWKVNLTDTDIDQEEIDAVISVISSGWLTMGEKTAEFEKKFAEKISVKHAIAVSNGTAALHLAHLALGIKKGDEVICPVLTFVAAANVIKATGATPVFADVISEHDLNINPEFVKKLITDKTKAISILHYGGYPCQIEEIMKIAEENNLFVIEDCAHAPLLNLKINSKKEHFAGSMGEIGCFSFYGNKNITTGEGGMLTTNNDELANNLKLLRSHGMTSLTFERHKSSNTDYDVLDVGLNYRIDEIRSAIGLVQLNKLDEINRKRRSIVDYYIEKLEGIDNIIIPFKNHDRKYSACHIMPVIVKEKYDELRDTLNTNSIQTSKHYKLITKFTAYYDPSFKSKCSYIDNILTLPLSPKMTTVDVDYITEVIRKVLH